MNKYVGMRYVPIIRGEWDSTKQTTYEPLEIVLNAGASYTSKTYVPKGIDITNTKYWVCTGNYNAQIEQYRTEVNSLISDFSDLSVGLQEEFESMKTNIKNSFPFIIASQFGATGNGVSDDSSAIQSAIDFAKEKGGTVYLEDGKTYKINSSLRLYSNVNIQMGRTATIDMSNVTSNPKCAFIAQGITGDALMLSVDSTIGLYTITLSSTTGLNVGDWVQLGTQGSNYYPFSSYNVDRGEIKRIRKIDGNKVTFETALYDNYYTVDNAFIRKINFIENVSIVGGRIVGTPSATDNEHGIYFSYVNNFRIESVYLENQDQYQIGLMSCIKGNVLNNHERMTFYDGINGTIFYGIALLDACQWINISNNHGSRMRHLVVTSAHSASQGYWGCPRHINVIGNIAENMMGGDGGRSYAYEHHGFGDDIMFQGNIADSCYSGFNIEGRGCYIIDNIITNWYYGAISFGDGGDFCNIVIRGNKIGTPSADGGVPLDVAIPIRADFKVGDVINNLVIENNIINYLNNYGYAIYFQSKNGVMTTKQFIIRNNTLANKANTSTQYAIYIGDLENIVIDSNTANNVSNAIYLNTNKCIVNGNVVSCNDYKATNGNGLYIKGVDNIVTNNLMVNVYSPICVYNGSENNIIANNVYRSYVDMTDSGINTTKQNNIFSTVATV